MRKINGVIYAMLSSIGFGFMPIFTKIAYNNGLNPVTVVALRFLVASILLLGYFIIFKVNFKINKKQFIILMIIGVLGYSTTALTLFLSYNYIAVGLATTMHFIYPALVTILSFIIYKEKLSKYKIISLVLSLIGIYVLVGVDIGGISLKGSCLALFSGLSYATCVVSMGNKALDGLDNKIITFYLSVFSAIAMLFYGGIKGELITIFNIYSILAVLGVSIISTILAIILFLHGVKIIGTSNAAILSTFEPIVGVIMGIIIFKEVLTKELFLGSILIISSVIILSCSVNNKSMEIEEEQAEERV
ncbi:DMT family transporter [uncultured Clostridium sp.]|uniref:DMT family transporter n=1 Tax=uncultured Clostridium sp. TaxID=59620 RepID=UPI00258876BD|nr:EamA family transporter [uncultured Clostridium sp.]MDU1350361.1 EamA family transporter [Clostridium argentinense]